MSDASPSALRVREDLIQPDPLLDCLVEVCRLHGRVATRASLAAGLPLRGSQLTLDLAERAAARAGFSARLQRMALEDIDPATLPVILVLHDNKVGVLAGWHESGEAELLLPETGHGEVRMARQDLAARYSGLALFLRPHYRFERQTASAPDEVDVPLDGRPAWTRHWFWGAVAEQHRLYADVLLAALLINAFALALPLFSMNVYDRVVPNLAFDTLWALGIGVLLVLVGDLLMRLLRSRFVDEASARVDVRLSALLMERVLGMRMEGRPASVGSFASNLRGFEQVRDFIAAGTVTALIDLPFALLFLIVILAISPWLALPVLLIGAAMLALGWALQSRLHTLAQTTYAASAQRNATLIEALSALETIKSQSAEGLVQARWEQANAFLAATQVQMRALSARASQGTQVLAQAAPVLIVILGVYLIANGNLTMGGLIACSMLAGRALAPAGSVVGLMLQYQQARTALEGLDKLVAQAQERESGATGLHKPVLDGRIEFRNVSFAYPGRDDKVLEGISFSIEPGERVALIGRVGSGKSTIQRLVMGLYQPSGGAVLLDGIDLRQFDLSDVRRNLSYVAQDVTLFQGTLRDNIAFGQRHATDEAVLEAAEIAGLADFVKRHPRGFDLPVGERGELLSGGQRQCVGIARAVVHAAPLLLLDEPTSAMDFGTEAQITQRLQGFAQGRTVLLVTHRTSLLALVNRVIVVDGGRIVADGPRERIMEALAAGRINKAG